MVNIPELHRPASKAWRYQLAKYEKDWKRLPPWVCEHWDKLAEKERKASSTQDNQENELIAVGMLKI